MRLKPQAIEIRRTLAWVLATCAERSVRDGRRAVELAEGANQATGGKDAAVLDTLAAADAEAGRYGEAVRTEEGAIEAAKEAGREELVGPMQERLELYREGRAYHVGSASAQ